MARFKLIVIACADRGRAGICLTSICPRPAALRYRMRRFLTPPRTLGTGATLLAAALAVMVVAGLVHIAHAPAAHAQPHAHVADPAMPGHEGAPAHAHAGMNGHPSCCAPDAPEGPPATDCATICAAMAGCHLQVLPAEAQQGLHALGMAAIAGTAACRTEFFFAPPTPPPRA